jgi:hypothetical protein
MIFDMGGTGVAEAAMEPQWEALKELKRRQPWSFLSRNFMSISPLKESNSITQLK